MKFKSNFSAFVLLMLFSSCSTNSEKSLTREEYLSITTREYQGRSKDELIQVASQVVSLVDPSDFKISHTEDGFIAQRNWLIYAVLYASAGTDTWVFKTSKTKNGYKASLSISTAKNGFAPMVTSGGDLTGVGIPRNYEIIDGDAPYTTFWERMTYLLGDTSNEWPSCPIAEKNLKEGKFWGSLDQLCSVTTDDLLPLELTEDSFVKALGHYNQTDHHSIISEFNKRRGKAGLDPIEVN